MAAAKRAPKAEAPEPAPTDEPVTDETHSGPGHDWRNPDAVFADDDHCPNAEMRRLADR